MGRFLPPYPSDFLHFSTNFNVFIFFKGVISFYFYLIKYILKIMSIS